MKLRILGNTVRLRLRKSEVARFADEGRLAMEADFGGGRRLVYALETAAVPAMVAEFDGERIVVRVPVEQGRAWALSNEVSLAGQSGALGLLIEKDFRRTSRPGEYDHDLYPNPRSKGVHSAER